MTKSSGVPNVDDADTRTAAGHEDARARRERERKDAQLAAWNRYVLALAAAPHPRLRKLIELHAPQPSIYSPEYAECHRCEVGISEYYAMWPCEVFLIASGQDDINGP